ncbi:MAG: Crp/Fnr family transcriptional regulator [Thermodesulfobacteriota bacterium]
MLEGFPLFANLAREQREKLEEMAQEICLKKGTMIFAPGDQTQGLYMVREGAVRVFRLSPQGKEITQEIAGRGSAFALASLYSDTYHCFAAALKDSRLFLIKKKEFMTLVTADIKFAGEWIRMLSLLVIRLRQRLSDLTLKAPKGRIASYLVLLSEMQDSRSITLPVPRKELATLLGMTHETFYRTTKEMENAGLVRVARQKVDILDWDLLTEMTE